MSALDSARQWARAIKRDVVALWIAARDPRALEQAAALAAESGLTLHPLALDITDSAGVETALAQLPALDVLVNSAGLARHEPFLSVSEANFDAVMTLNLRATVSEPARITTYSYDDQGRPTGQTVTER